MDGLDRLLGHVIEQSSQAPIVDIRFVYPAAHLSLCPVTASLPACAATRFKMQSMRLKLERSVVCVAQAQGTRVASHIIQYSSVLITLAMGLAGSLQQNGGSQDVRARRCLIGMQKGSPGLKCGLRWDTSITGGT